MSGVSALRNDISARQLRSYIDYLEKELVRIKKGLGVHGETIKRFEEKKQWEEKAISYGVQLERDLELLNKKFGQKNLLSRWFSSVSCALNGENVCSSKRGVGSYAYLSFVCIPILSECVCAAAPRRSARHQGSY